MAKNSNKLDELRLLREQNELLREQIELLKQVQAQPDDGEIFVDNIDRDEIRDGCLITSHQKKLWNSQLKMIKVFADICRKHNIRWFAYGGTLLGAARHKGFIPWDDDIDLVMLRPDYEKFSSVVEEELKAHPYYRTWYWFNYRLESDNPAVREINSDLPPVTLMQEKLCHGLAPLHPLMRILDDRTTFMMHDFRRNVFFNGWIDILCLDPCPPFADNSEAHKNFLVAKELLAAATFPEQMRAALQKNPSAFVLRKSLPDILKQSYKQRARTFELFSSQKFSRTEYVGEIRHHCITDKKLSYKLSNFDETIYMPFEKVELPMPAGYDNILTDIYGDWHKLVVTHIHSHEYSTDVPYYEYKQDSLLMKRAQAYAEKLKASFKP